MERASDKSSACVFPLGLLIWERSVSVNLVVVLRSIKMLSSFARDILKPQVANTLDTYMRSVSSETNESTGDLGPNYGSFMKQNGYCGNSDDGDFKLYLNVSQFKPKDIIVKRLNNELVIQAKHELKPDEHGYVSREFTRSIKIPNDVEKDTIKLIFNKYGILTIKASKKKTLPELETGAEIIPLVVQTPIGIESAPIQRIPMREYVPTGTEYIVKDVGL